MPSNISRQYISYKFSFVMSISVMSDLINIILIRAYTSSLPVPFIYLISGLYYSKKLLSQHSFCCKILVHDILCSIYTVIRCPNIIVWNYFIVSNILNSYIYLVVYLIFQGLDYASKSKRASHFR